MITIEALNKSIVSRGRQYSNDELETIRRDLYQLAHLLVKYYLKNQKTLEKSIK